MLSSPWEKSKEANDSGDEQSINQGVPRGVINPRMTNTPKH
jgi:hypothetical protein